MERKGAERHRVLDLLEDYGGLTAANVERIARETGVPAADVYGVASFYTLVSEPEVDARVCQGLSCALRGADELAASLEAKGLSVRKVSCLGQCDRAPAAIDRHCELSEVGPEGAITPSDPELPINLAGEDRADYAALKRARELGAEAVIDLLKASGLQGRGGAGFPIAIKLASVRSQDTDQRYVVVNADESEPATFKDRECMLRRPHKLIEGTAIAAFAAKADKGFIYIRGEFAEAKRRVEAAIAEAGDRLDGLELKVVAGHGAYICGEETALLEALEGRRGMPRLKPPYPTVKGLWGKPTLINNVETLCCIPSIVERGAEWFRGLGREEPGTKLYCISGHIERPGVYELPLGASLDELVAAAGGYVGTPRAFSPGGASSGFLPMSERGRRLDFKSLPEVGSMLGSAGVVVLNDTVDMAEAARWQQVFFEDESCGQCAPCRIGCRIQRRALDDYRDGKDPRALAMVEDVHWEMEEGSICGLGIVASQPLISAMRHFPEDFSMNGSGEV